MGMRYAEWGMRYAEWGMRYEDWGMRCVEWRMRCIFALTCEEANNLSPECVHIQLVEGNVE